MTGKFNDPFTLYETTLFSNIMTFLATGFRQVDHSEDQEN